MSADRGQNGQLVNNCLLRDGTFVAKPPSTDRWPSGRRRTPGKCVGGEPSPWFESLSVRHRYLLSS